MAEYIIDIDGENAIIDGRLHIPVEVSLCGASNKPARIDIVVDNKLTPYVKSEVYQRGLNDAWETARTLWNAPNRKEIFGHITFNTVLTTLTAQETIEKIRQYEQRQEEQIQVGDEVKSIERGWTAVVARISDDNSLTLMDSNGAIADAYNITMFVKTGRHFPEIAEVLQKMKEDDG